MFVFSIKIDFPIFKKIHKAAVKGLDWSKHKRGIFASGAGTSDQFLRIWSLN